MQEGSAKEKPGDTDRKQAYSSYALINSSANVSQLNHPCKSHGTKATKTPFFYHTRKSPVIQGKYGKYFVFFCFSSFFFKRP